MWFIPQYILILFLLIIIDYGMGILIEDARLKGLYAKRYLIISIAATCAVWFVFKYFNFFSLNLCALAGFFSLHYPPKILNLIIPLGLSFHTLQSLSYVIEVYRGRQKAEHHLGIYALYVMFYPQLVAGPIERPYNLLPQLREKHDVEYQRIADALKLMAWGMFKKVVIADRLSVLVDQVFGDVHSYRGPEFALAAIFFALQLYCDFSGYTDIAIGSAKAMGFRLTNNFNFPFFSRSMSEYWMRWNISLSSWFRDYIYLPLIGRGCGMWRWQLSILLTLLLAGLWHGADWTYVFCGAVNGVYIISAMRTLRLRERIYKIMGLRKNNILFKSWQIAVSFSLLSFSLIFFRAKNLKEALYIIVQLPHGWGGSFLKNCYMSLGFERKWWILSVDLIAALFLMDLLQQNAGGKFVFAKDSAWVRWAYYYGLILAMVFWGNYEQNQFIYFQF